MGNSALGKTRLSEAERMVKGWNGIQGKVALAYLLLGEKSNTVAVIRAALKENPKWKENLSAFYLLRNEPGMRGLIDEKKFSEKDWIGAVSLLRQLNRNSETELLSRRALQTFPGSSYLHFQLGETLLDEGRREEAKKELQDAVKLDPLNGEAVKMLEK
jgi:tetratricopeptide (TPR) repeat protein